MILDGSCVFNTLAHTSATDKGLTADRMGPLIGGHHFVPSATRIPDGKGYKFTAENVALLLNAAMKDVSPDT